MNVKPLIFVALAIAFTSGTARSKGDDVVVRIECSNPTLQLHFPKHIGTDPTFELVSTGTPIGSRADKATIAVASQLISCHSIKYGSDFPNLSAYYHYTMKRPVRGCTSVSGNFAAVDCKVQP